VTPPALAAVAAVRCGAEGEALHRVGVTVRGQAVMLDHDRTLERLALGLEPEARTACGRVYDDLRAELATRTTRGALSRSGVPPDPIAGDELEDYIDGCRQINRRRQAVQAHTARLAKISVLAGGPPLLPDWAKTHPEKVNPFRTPEADGLTLQGRRRARRDALDRLIPGLFLNAGYPIVARHPPAQPGVRRGACWHITVGELGPTDVYQIATTPHPDGRGRVCHAVSVPLAPDWYRDVYKAGAAVVDGSLVCKLGPPGSGGGDAHGALLLVQRGARLRLEDHPIAPGPSGWARVPAGGAPRGAGGTGSRPSPWD
jgi:hypothetical protein